MSSSVEIVLTSSVKINELKKFNFIENYNKHDKTNAFYIYKFNGDVHDIIDKKQLQSLKDKKEEMINIYNKKINHEYINTFIEYFKNRYNTLDNNYIQKIIEFFETIDEDTLKLYMFFNSIEEKFITSNEIIIKSEKYNNLCNEYTNLLTIVNKISYLNNNYKNNIKVLLSNINKVKNIDNNVIFATIYDYIKTFINNSVNNKNITLEKSKIILTSLEKVHSESKTETESQTETNSDNTIKKTDYEKFEDLIKYNKKKIGCYKDVVGELIKTEYITYLNEKKTDAKMYSDYHSVEMSQPNSLVISAKESISYTCYKFYDNFETFINYCINEINELNISELYNLEFDTIVKNSLKKYYDDILTKIYNFMLLYECKIIDDIPNFYSSRKLENDNFYDKDLVLIINTLRALISDENYVNYSEENEYILFKNISHFKDDFYQIQEIVRNKIIPIINEKNDLLNDIDKEINDLLPFKCIQKYANFIGKNYKNNIYHLKLNYITTSDYNKNKDDYYNFYTIPTKTSKMCNLIDENGNEVLDKNGKVKKCLKHLTINVKDKVNIIKNINLRIISKIRIKLIEPENIMYEEDEYINPNILHKNEHGNYIYNIAYDTFGFENIAFDVIFLDLNYMKNIISLSIE